MRLTKTMKAFIALFLLPLGLIAQITTGSITGTVKDASGTVLQGATVEAIHEPSGTKYSTASNKTGKFNLPSLRVGGPYKVTVTYVGFKTETATEVFIQLGEPSIIEFSMSDAKTDLKEITLTTTKKGALISKDRKGTSTNINSRLISSLPTLNRSITDITKLTPQSNGTSFAGQDNRAINFTLDGSIFNNSFGLQPLNGSQTNSTPISLDAIQELQINVSPYNLRDAGFTGASINAVTKSGTNTFHGTGFYNIRNEGLVGTKAGAGGKEDVITNAFEVKQYGVSFGGPIIKNKLFFFANYEAERRTDLPPIGITTINSKLDSLANFLDSAYKYRTGGYSGYNMLTKSDKGVLRIDWNISDKHKLSIRGNFLTSNRDVQISNSNALNGPRFGTTSISYANSNYEIHNDIYGVVAQLNSRLSNNVSNELTFGYTANRDYRSIKGNSFPTVDIQDASSGRTLISFGVDPFTPNNKLNTDTWQFSDNLTVYKGKHTVSMGLSYESFTYLNGFTPRINGIYTFKSLDDFYTDARYMLANPNATTMPKALGGYSATWSNLPDGGVWYATTKARTIGAYVQDDYELNKNFNITYGVRFDIPFFANEGTKNTEVDNLNFVNEKGESTKLSTSKLPRYKVMVNPRIGFNYDVNGDKSVQIRGGMGLFTGRPPFVFISNQMGNNGVMNGDVNYTGSFGNGTTTGPTATQIPFVTTTPAKPIVGYGYPASIPGQAASTYNIATTEQNFRFPQIFRSNLALDYKITKDIIGSIEGIFTQSMSNIFYYNANLIPSAANFNGMDNRPRFGAVANGTLGANNTFPTASTDPNRIITPSVASIRINPKVTDATVMKSGPLGGSFMTTLKLEKPIKSQGFGWMAAYNFGYTRDFINPGSIAASSWTGNKSVNGNNRPDIAFSDYDVRNRLIANLNYRKEIFKNMAVQFSLFYEGRNWGRFSYAYTGDMNGDGVSGNDLMFIPTTAQLSQMKFENYSLGGIVQTQAMQQVAFENYIQQDKYLSSRRGEYAERNGVLMPTVNRFDISAMVELFKNIGKDRHTIQIRADIFNVGNLINSNSGVSYIVNNASPITFRAVDNATGLPVFRMGAVNNSLNYSTYRKGTSTADVWQMQIGIRYIF